MEAVNKEGGKYGENVSFKWLTKKFNILETNSDKFDVKASVRAHI